MGSIFSQGEFFIRIGSQTIPLKSELPNQLLIFDTYYRQMHLPQIYFDDFIKKEAIYQYTCNLQSDISFNESDQLGEYVCNCHGTADFNGLPNISFTYLISSIGFVMTPQDYLFYPYLNYTSRLTKCVMALSGDLKVLPPGVKP